MSNTDAQLLAAVQQQTDQSNQFVNEQIAVFTSTDPTVTVTDPDGNPVVIPSWHALQAAVGASGPQSSGGGGLTVWDARASEVSVPLKLTVLDPVFYSHLGPVEKYPVIDSTGLMATSQANGQSVGTDLVFAGAIPRTGKYWFTAKATFTSVTQVDAQITFSNLSDIGPTGTLVVDVALLPNGINVIDASGDNFISTTEPLAPTVLVCVDVDDSTVSVYGTSGLIGTVNAARDSNNVSLLANGTVACVLDAQNADFSLSVNSTDPSKSPFAIPSGYVGLTLVNAVPPATLNPGQFVLTTTDSSLNGYFFQAYRLYVIGALGGTSPIYSFYDYYSLSATVTGLQAQLVSATNTISTMQSQIAALQSSVTALQSASH
jgi:hypothetical protein